MTQQEAENQVIYNTKVQRFCPTIRRECNMACICYIPSKAHGPNQVRDDWEVTPVGCSHINHPMPHRSFDNMSCTFPPHVPGKRD